MKLAHIAPTSVLQTDVFKNLDFHLCLASEVLRSYAYAAYYRQAQGYVILDVPTWEDRNGAYDFNKLTRAIELVQPSEVTLPDIWGGGAKEHIELALNALLVLPQRTTRGTLGFMAIPRGHTWDELVYCAKSMASMPGVTALGILDETYEKFNAHRLQVALEFSERFPDKKLHLLGVKQDFSDIQDATLRKWVRSADTAKLVRFGLECKHPIYRNIPDYAHRGEDYFDREVSELQLSYIARNVRYWNELVGDKHR